MNQPLNIALFAHSMISDWNHGNAHFLRGLMRELVRMGHNVRCYEELSSWSLTNLMKCEGQRAIEAIDAFRRIYSELDIRFYNSSDDGFQKFLEEELKDADLVLLHEWNDPAVVNQAASVRSATAHLLQPATARTNRAVRMVKAKLIGWAAVQSGLVSAPCFSGT